MARKQATSAASIKIPEPGPGYRECILCRKTPGGPVADLTATHGITSCICLDCAERCARWLRRWAPVIRRYRRTGKLKVLRREAVTALNTVLAGKEKS